MAIGVRYMCMIEVHDRGALVTDRDTDFLNEELEYVSGMLVIR